MKKVFLDDLPRYEKGKYKGKINWKESINKNIDFTYDNILGSVKIIDYIPKKQRLIIKYLDNSPFIIATYSFARCSLGELLGKIKHKHSYAIGDIIKTNTGTIKLLDLIKIQRKDNNIRGYQYICLIDGYKGTISEYDLKNSRGCPVCNTKVIKKGINDIATNYPHLIKYFINIEDTYKYSHASDKRLSFKCPNCGYIKKDIQIKTFIRNNGFICPQCGDGKSYPEKFMFNLLEQLQIKFIIEYNPEWSKPKRYDFYFEYNNEKYILETHGEQHYVNSFKCIGSRSLKKEKENDKIKKELAIKNGIKKENYIVIDCRESILEFIKNNILDSKLNNIIDLNKIDWLKCHEFACKSRVKEMSDIWNSGIHSTLDIAKIANIHNSTVRRYLKIGRDIGWNNYDEDIARRAGAKKQKIKVICLNTLEVFDSSKEVEEKYNIHKTDVWRLCHNKGNFISVNNNPYVFMYYDDYLKQPKEIKNIKIKKAKDSFFKSPIPKQVICLNTLKVYLSLKAAAEENNIVYVGISNCCRGKAKHAGKLKDGTKLTWMYYEDYLKLTDDEENII